jgi:autotransporter adhesin
LTGVANGSVSATSSDAVNGGQLYATNTAVAATTSYATNAATGVANVVGGGTSVDALGNVTAPQLTVQGQTYSTVATAVGAIDTELTSQATTINNVINNFSQGQRYIRVNGTGNDASASGSNAIAIGVNTTSSGKDAIAMGTNSIASQDGAIAIGTISQATGRNAIAIGSNAVATGSVAVGVNARASNGGAAFGDNAVATSENSSSLGPGATAVAPNSVAIGSGSVNTVANTVSVGSPGNERRITNVEAGISSTDAVNVGQLNGLAANFNSQITRLDQRIDNTAGGVAMAMALTGSSLPSDKNFAAALNIGAFGGQTAVGISEFLRVSNNVVVSGGVALQDRQVGGRAGVMMAW